MAITYLGIGSNIGDKESNLKEAVFRLETTGNAAILDRSLFYETHPAGGPRQENYLNGVLKVKTGIPPGEFLDLLKVIEEDMGRKPSAERNHPRIIDIDILLYDDLILNTGKLTVPHPRMHERVFVLKGLAAIAPGAVHPVLEKTVEELYGELKALGSDHNI
ncbi:MAG: 2-amino-4-hydroxy-6-hydroxymethyldihydropteridine diphosphokinase [Candidatus Omnitrophota bacterium]|nr:2-amino-4-hydroxy-6-hydroxymethyldihydropteridine diphosphokinase [Candidatus Omnitrophota bacterium]